MFMVVLRDPGFGDQAGSRRDRDGEVGAMGGSRPFQRIRGAFLSVFRMMLGDFSPTWFEISEEPDDQWIADGLFCLYMIFVMIFMLNVLIAVVSDSYDCARVKATNLFRRARFEFVAQLDTIGATREGLEFLQPVLRPISSLFSKPLPKEGETDEDTWLGHSMEMRRQVAKIVAASEQRTKIDINSLAELSAERAERVENVLSRIQQDHKELGSMMTRLLELHGTIPSEHSETSI